MRCSAKNENYKKNKHFFTKKYGAASRKSLEYTGPGPYRNRTSKALNALKAKFHELKISKGNSQNKALMLVETGDTKEIDNIEKSIVEKMGPRFAKEWTSNKHLRMSIRSRLEDSSAKLGDALNLLSYA